MKRILISACLLMTMQSLRAQHFMAGLSGSALVSDVQGTDNRDFDNDFYKAGYSLGAFVNRQMDNKNILQLEINYIQKGAEQIPDSNNNGYFKMVFNYIEVPVVLRHRMHLTVNKAAYNNFEWELGVSGGYLFSASYTGGNGYAYSFIDGLNKVDISVLGGINYILSPSIYLGVRYSNSIIPVIKRDGLPPNAASEYSLSFNNGNNLIWAFCLKYIIAGNKTESSDK